MKILSTTLFVLLFLSCAAQEVSKVSNLDSVSIGITGDPKDVTVPTEFGINMVGGSTDVDEALQWMISKAKGGDVVIIRASGSTGYNDYIFRLGAVNSVETLLINSREKAMNERVGKRIREAEMLFIAGGDQSNYVKFWKGTPVSEAIQYLINEKKVPIGGTSAGCAVLSDIIFDAMHDTAISATVLQNPYDSTVSLSKSFMRTPFLENTIADQHYSQRERHGRHVTFLARMMKDFGVKKPLGIGVDEKTAVCVDKDGNAKVFGTNKAHFIISSGKPENCLANTPLEWNQKNKALRVYIFQASKTGTPAFNLKSWPKGKPTENWYVEGGALKRKQN